MENAAGTGFKRIMSPSYQWDQAGPKIEARERLLLCLTGRGFEFLGCIVAFVRKVIASSCSFPSPRE